MIEGHAGEPMALPFHQDCQRCRKPKVRCSTIECNVSVRWYTPFTSSKEESFCKHELLLNPQTLPERGRAKCQIAFWSLFFVIRLDEGGNGFIRPEPGYDLNGGFEYPAHELNLMAPFLYRLLVDADLVDPRVSRQQNLLGRRCRRLSQGILDPTESEKVPKILSDHYSGSIDGDCSFDVCTPFI